MLHTPSKRRTFGALVVGALVSIAMLPALAAQNAASTLPRVKLQTTEGDIVVELNPAKAPKTVENFLQYVDDKSYDGTIFHRVIDNFMIQGGGLTEDMQQKTTRAPIVLESDNSLKNERGTIAMARTSMPNSATSQFFINVNNNTTLDFKPAIPATQATSTKPANPGNPGNPGYAVFGKVIEGMDVVDKIKATPTTVIGGQRDVPATPITIISATKIQ